MTDGPVGALRAKLLQRTTIIAAAAVVVVLARGVPRVVGDLSL